MNRLIFVENVERETAGSRSPPGKCDFWGCFLSLNVSDIDILQNSCTNLIKCYQMKSGTFTWKTNNLIWTYFVKNLWQMELNEKQTETKWKQKPFIYDKSSLRFFFFPSVKCFHVFIAVFLLLSAMKKNVYWVKLLENYC